MITNFILPMHACMHAACICGRQIFINVMHADHSMGKEENTNSIILKTDAWA